MKTKSIVYFLFGLFLAYVLWNCKRSNKDENGYLAMLINHPKSDIPIYMKSYPHSHLVLTLTSKDAYEKFIKGSVKSPETNLRFKKEVMYYQLGNMLHVGSILIFIDEQNDVYAIHWFLEG